MNKLLPLAAIGLLCLALAGCAAPSYPTSSKVPQKATARAIAESVGCTDISVPDIYLGFAKSDGPDAAAKFKKTESEVDCSFHDNGIEITAFTQTRSARSTFTMMTTASAQREYILFGPLWNVTAFDAEADTNQHALDAQKALLTRVQAQLGGELFEVAKAP